MGIEVYKVLHCRYGSLVCKLNNGVCVMLLDRLIVIIVLYS